MYGNLYILPSVPTRRHSPSASNYVPQIILWAQPPSASHEMSLAPQAETVSCYLFMFSYESYVGADKHWVVTAEADYTNGTAFSYCSTRGRHAGAY